MVSVLELMMRAFVMVFAFVLGLAAAETEVYAKSCDYSWQTAKNGSRCGARAKSARKSSSYAR